MPPIINEKRCNGCGICVTHCPMDVFYGSEKGEIPIIAYPDECWHENACVNDCPEDAIELRIPLSMMVIYR